MGALSLVALLAVLGAAVRRGESPRPNLPLEFWVPTPTWPPFGIPSALPDARSQPGGAQVPFDGQLGWLADEAGKSLVVLITEGDASLSLKHALGLGAVAFDAQYQLTTATAQAGGRSWSRAVRTYP